MPVGVFISWSGSLSQKLGEALREWLPSALQTVKPYFSPQDIEKGSRWSNEISVQLAQTNIGIICVTRDNTEKPWILFEAGALSKSLDKSNVCPLLFNLDPTEVKGPLATFQATKFCREDFKLLIETINGAAGDASLEPRRLEYVFDIWWPKLEDKISSILREEDKTPPPTRTQKDMIEEILELTRASARQARVTDMPPQVAYALFDALSALQEHMTKRGDAEGFHQFIMQARVPLARVWPNEAADHLLRLLPRDLHNLQARPRGGSNWPTEAEREAAPESY